MKQLSFIALFFYLSSLLPAAQFSAVHNWVDLPQNSPVHSLSQLTSAAQPVKHSALSDDNDKTIVRLSHTSLVAVGDRICQSVLVEVYAIFPLSFFARAPPYYKS